MITVVVDVLQGCGLALLVVAGIGANRFRSAYGRLHAAAVASTSALSLLLLAAGLESGSFTGAGSLLLTGALVLVMLPAASHLLARAVHRSRMVPPEIVGPTARPTAGPWPRSPR